MWGFSKKRFFITLGLSVGVWVVSMFMQAIFTLDDLTTNFSLLGSSCEVTGYPIALCLDKNKMGIVVLIYLINIGIWFWIIHFLWGLFSKRGQST